MFRLLLIGITCSLLLACASTAPVATTEAAPPPAAEASTPEKTVPERAFPDDSIYPLLLAEFALRRGAYDVAMTQYLEQAPKLRDAGVSAHATHLAQFTANEEAALEAAQLWIELEPDNIEANSTYAILLIRQGRAIEALPHMAYLAQQGEDVNFPTLLSGYSQLDAQQRDALANGINQLALEHPDDVQLLLTQAMVLAETEQFDAALQSLQQLFELEPNHSQAAMLEARILLAQKSPEPYARLERILEENPQDTQVRLHYARLLTATDMAAAREQFELLSAQAPRDGELLLSLALISREVGDDAAAKNYLRQLLALEQHVDEAHYYLGKIAEDAGDSAAALYEYRQVEGGRELLVATSRGSQILIAQGRIEENHEWFNELRKQHPQDAEQLYGIEADLLSRADQLSAASRVLEQGLAQMPQSSALRYSRAMLAEQQGELALMERELRAIIASEPDNSTAINALGYTLANRTQRYEEAYTLISQALALQPNEPAILDSMGWVLYRLNRYEEAVVYLTRAYAEFPDPEVAAHLGEVLWVSGDTEGAMRVWQGALLKDPENPVLAETLQRLQVDTTDFDLPGRPGPGANPTVSGA
ncbi:MAG: tetratricopeptide repeat protein [Pseudomonadales bacterium]|nr:tetratricopeptide repeat protein [Halioglobus sp.]MCP5131533.1 tetratricopeptide repeat protein [Pseudomonadales bacterium]